MAPKPVIHTLESILARADEVGLCLEWRGSFNGKSPMLKIAGKHVPVRRLIRQLMGRPAPEGHFAMPSCGNCRCVKPEHISVMPPEKFYSKLNSLVNHQDPIRTGKIRLARRHARVLTEEQAQEIRLDPRPNRQVAAEYGCSPYTVYRIRSGIGYKPLTAASNPFTGLIR